MNLSPLARIRYRRFQVTDVVIEADFKADPDAGNRRDSRVRPRNENGARVANRLCEVALLVVLEPHLTIVSFRLPCVTPADGSC